MKKTREIKVDFIITLINKGYNQTRVAKMMGVSASTVSRYVQIYKAKKGIKPFRKT
jgi:predicted transcriptional regulator